MNEMIALYNDKGNFRTLDLTINNIKKNTKTVKYETLDALFGGLQQDNIGIVLTNQLIEDIIINSQKDLLKLGRGKRREFISTHPKNSEETREQIQRILEQKQDEERKETMKEITFPEIKTPKTILIIDDLPLLNLQVCLYKRPNIAHLHLNPTAKAYKQNKKLFIEKIEKIDPDCILLDMDFGESCNYNGERVYTNLSQKLKNITIVNSSEKQHQIDGKRIFLKEMTKYPPILDHQISKSI